MTRTDVLQSGSVLAGRYRIEAQIGQGGFGTVFRALQLPLERPVAVKVLLPNSTTEWRARFEREAKLVQRLDHPHTVRLLAGTSYRVVLPLSLLFGAAFLALADLAARTLMSPTEIPIGVVTAFFGAPFFVVVLRTSRRVGI